MRKRAYVDAASSLDATVTAAAVGSERFVTRTAYMAGDAFSSPTYPRTPSRSS